MGDNAYTDAIQKELNLPFQTAEQLKKGQGVDIGKCLSLTSLSAFVANLEAPGYFKNSIDIVSTTIRRPDHTYTVVLTVVDNKGQSNSTTQKITVQ
jgi:hypothetical protein